jgi:hypothetical protein
MVSSIHLNLVRKKKDVLRQSQYGLKRDRDVGNMRDMASKRGEILISGLHRGEGGIFIVGCKFITLQSPRIYIF